MKANSSFPHPVLGVNKGVLPDLNDNAFSVIDCCEKDGYYCYTFELNQDNSQIANYIKEGNAVYVCEVDCSKTLYKKAEQYSTNRFEVRIAKNKVVGHVDFSFFIATTGIMPSYKNNGFHPDYRDPSNGTMPSFYLETGSVLVLFPEWSDNVNIRFNNKPELKSFIQVAKHQDGVKEVSIDLSEDIINVYLPVKMFVDFMNYNKDDLKGLFFVSLISNALVKGILNVSKNEGKTWADSILGIVEASPEKYKGLDLDNPADAVDIAMIMLSHPAYGSPYDLLFDSINKLQ